MDQPDFDYLGPYHIEKTLGRGGMGTVYKGVHAKSGEEVAIKVIAASVADQSRFRRRFEAEIKTLQRLKHPNIVTLKGVGEEQGRLFYTMEYVDGFTLHDLLRKEGKLVWEDVVEIGIQTMAALKHAHDLGTIHRDLKPANLMLNREGELKLTDFGIAKLFGATDMTVVGTVIGTADYMPPEQAEGKPVTVKSDLYGIGGVLYALLTGRPPFGGKSVPEVLYAVRYNSVPRLDDQVEGVPPELCQLIHQMLEKSPSNRPPTALVVGNRLKALQKGMEKRKSEPPAEPMVSKPKVGSKLTSLDLSDVEDQELRITNAEESVTSVSSSDLSSEGLDETDPHDQATMLAPEVKKLRPGDETPTALASKAMDSLDFAHEEPTPSPIPESQLSAPGPSHYKPVETSNESSFTLTSEEEPEEKSETDWGQVVSIIGMVLLLLACIGFGWYMLPRTQSEEDLHASIVAAADTGDDDELLAVKSDVQEFLRRFPDSDHAAAVQLIADGMELSRWTQILRRRASNAGGRDALSALEQSFLDCMQVRESDYDRGQTMLVALVKVFAPVEGLNPSEQRLVQLAQFALESGKEVSTTDNQAAVELQEMIQKSEKALSGEKLNAYYRDLIMLFGDKPWAQDQMQRIRQRLEQEN